MLGSRRNFLHTAAGGLAGAALSACGSSANSADAQMLQIALEPSSNPKLLERTLKVARRARSIMPPGFIGYSFEKTVLTIRFLTAENTQMIGLLRALGPGTLRLGGNLVDLTSWNANGPGNVKGEVSPRDIEVLAGFLEATGWTVLYGLNMANSTPEIAAAEAASAARILGDRLAGFEIGNEPDMFYYWKYPPPAGFGKWSPQSFLVRWQEFRGAILRRIPGVAITGPGSAAHFDTWTVPFAREVGPGVLSLVTQHYYRGDGRLPSSNIAKLVSPDRELERMLAGVSAAAQAIGTPFQITETNSFYRGGAPHVSNTFASALWAIDHAFTIAKAGASGVNFHTGGRGPGYTPIAHTNEKVVEVRPGYYGMYLTALAGPGKLVDTSLDTGGRNITSYAIKAKGGWNVVLVNKDPDTRLRLLVEVPTGLRSANAIDLSAASLASIADVTLGGATLAPDGALPEARSRQLDARDGKCVVDVEPHSATLVRING